MMWWLTDFRIDAFASNEPWAGEFVPCPANACGPIFATTSWPPLHPLAELFPPMGDVELQALIDDIATRGQLNAAWLYDGQLIDGRNLLRACQQQGRPLKCREYLGDDPLGLVLALNMHRRHLNETQRAMSAVKLVNMVVGDNQYSRGSAHLLNLPLLISQADAAKRFNVGTRSVTAAASIRANAAPEVVRACELGLISLHAALQIARLVDRDTQREIVSGTASEVTKKLRHVPHLIALEKIAMQRTIGPADIPRITIADCLDWLPQQPSCDLLFTDPPFSTDVDDLDMFVRRWLPSALAKLKPTGRAYICIGPYPAEIATYLSIAIPTQILIRQHDNLIGPAPRDGYRENWYPVLYYRRPDAPPLTCPLLVERFGAQIDYAPDGRSGTRFHTWQKSDDFAEQVIRHASREGDLVLDPFAGTGTFVLAASRLGRIGRGCDIDPAHAGIARQRGCALEPS
jgi:hypothetical protein